MLTATGSQLVHEVLDLFTAQCKVFTVYDVTKEVRKETDERIDHRDVRSIVHDAWLTQKMDSDYRRHEGIELSVDGNPLVIVYYPDTKSPYDHPLALPQSVPAAGSVTAPSQSFPSSTPSVSSITSRAGGSIKNADGSYTCTPTNEGRINIPKALIAKVDATGGSYDILVGGGVVCKQVNDDGRIRISLQKVGLYIDKDVTVAISDDGRSITISS